MDFQEYLRLQSRTFVQYYRCLSLSLLERENVNEDGNMVILPQSALDRLMHLKDVEYPMVFQIKNPSTERVTHCGVDEFIANEGFIHMPSRLMAHLGVEENEIVLVRNTSMPKATFIKLQPHTKDFLDVTHPRELLERSFFGKVFCVTAGETIAVRDGERRYYLDVLEAQPADAVRSFETDCEVDFAPPLDYVEPPPRVVAASQGKDDEPTQPVRFTGVAARMDGKPVEQQQPTVPPAAVNAVAPGVPKRKVRFGGPSAAGGGASKGKEEGGGKEQEKRFTGTQHSLNS